MGRFIIVLCGWLLPLLAFADGAADISLRLAEGTYRPGDVIEMQAEMGRAEYAEFELHVPANSQLHFVAHTRKPVQYVGGEYVQSVLLLLQPMTAGEFELDGITATLTEGGVSTEVALLPLKFTVASYAAEDMSQEAAALGAGSAVLPKQVSLLGLTLCVVLVLYALFWFLIRRSSAMPVETAVAELGLSDLILALEGNAPSLPPCEADVRQRRSVALQMIAEKLLERPDLSLSSTVREALEAAVYANRMDAEPLLELLRQEVAR
jgi:hypothetical protein